MPHLPELPLGNVPRTAYHKSHGLVRVLAYHGEGRFTVLTKHDSKVTVHRDTLSFRRDRFKKYYSELRRETPQEAAVRPRRLMQRLRGKQNKPGWMMATEDAAPFYFGGYKPGVEPDYTARHVKRFSSNVQKSSLSAAAVARHSKYGLLHGGAMGAAGAGIGEVNHDRRQGYGAAGGAVAGQLAYQGAGAHIARTTDAKARVERKVLAARGLSGTKQDKIADEHFAAHGLSRKTHTHNAADKYREMFRNYPLELPGAKEKRLLAYTHAGRSGKVIGGLATVAGGLGGAVALQDRKHVRKAASDRDRRRGASMVASGAVLGGGGLIAGGVPGVREPDSSRVWLLRGHKNGKMSPTEALRPSNLKHNARQVAPLTRAGILGFRADMHNAYITENKAKTKGSAYVQGMRRGKLEAEHKIVRGMRTARRAVYPATFAGAGLAYAGRKKMKGEPLRKRDTRSDTASAAAVAGGTGLAAFGHVTPKILNRHSRRYARSAQHHTLEAEKLAPHFGGLQVRPAKIGAFGEVRRPAKTTIYPVKTDAELRATRAGSRIKGGPEVRAQVGHHRGVAAQERHFVEVFDNTSRHIRRFRGPGLAVAGAGVSGLYAAHEHRNHQVRKATEFERGEGYERYAAERSRRRTATSGALWGTAATGAATGAATVGNAKLLGTKPGKLAVSAAQKHPTYGKVFANELKRAQKIGAHTAAHRGRYTAATLGLSAAGAGAGVMHRFRTQEETGMSQGIGRIKAGETYDRQRQTVGKSVLTHAVLASEVNWKDPRLVRTARFIRQHPIKAAAIPAGVGVTSGAVATGVGSKRRLAERTRLKQELGRTGQVAKATYGVQETEHKPAKTGRMLAGVGLLGFGVPRLRMTNKVIGTGRRITETGAKRAQVATGAGAVLTATGLPRNKHHFTPVQAQPVYG